MFILGKLEEISLGMRKAKDNTDGYLFKSPRREISPICFRKY